jgi:hypothetical protein
MKAKRKPQQVDEESVQEVLDSIPSSVPIPLSNLLAEEKPEYYVGNLTRDQFINGLTKTAREIPDLFRDWDMIDFDLKEEYADQLQWLLNAASLKLHDLDEKLKLAEEKLKEKNDK